MSEPSEDAVLFASELVLARSQEMFINQSNRIEGIHRAATEDEILAHREFWDGPLTVQAIEKFVRQIAGASLRYRRGMDVRVGGHTPARGGPLVVDGLIRLVEQMKRRELDPWQAHLQYEILHPFMDGNGRSGRAIWAWMMTDQGHNPFGLDFLHRFYYQTLDHQRS